MPNKSATSKPGVSPQNWKIDQLPGLSAQDCSNLKNCGIKTTLQLLKQSSPGRRNALAAHLQTHIQYVNKWLALADLAQIPSVGCQYNGLLLHSGVSSVAQLAQMSLHHLRRQILRFQVATLQRRDLCPSSSEMTQWIHQAQRLMNGDRG